MARFAVFVDGSNLFGALKSMNLEVHDYELLYGYLYKEAHSDWARVTHQAASPQSELRRVYWYVVGSIDEWDLGLPQSQTALRTAFSRDREIHDYWLSVAGKANPGMKSVALEDKGWALCFADFKIWYEGKRSTLDGMRGFYQGLRIRTDIIDVLDVGHWAGRVNTIEVGTLTVREISAIRGLGIISPVAKENVLESLSSPDFWFAVRQSGNAQRAIRDVAFAAFSERGGYPLVHERASVPWPQVADQLNETVIKRVIQHDLRIGDKGRKRDPALLEEFFRLACRYAGQSPGLELFAREVQRTLEANVGTQRVRHYLDFLDRTLLLRLVRPLEIRLKKTRGSNKICLADHGLRASWLQEIIPLDPSALDRQPHLFDLAGRIAESVVGTYLLTITGLDLAHFPSRADEPEVDFVATVGASRIPIEVKYRRRIEHSDTEGLRSFIEHASYNAKFGILVTQDDCPNVTDPRIITIPLSSFLIAR